MSENMSKASIIVSYDGKALKNHTMDIRELTSSLTGLADIFQEANLVLNKGQATTSIQVKAFKAGSFEIHFDVVQAGINFLGSFNNPTITGALNLATILGFSSSSAVGLFQFIKFLKGKGIKNKDISGDEVGITNEFGDSITINYNVYELYQNQTVRKGFEKAAQPLLSEDIEKLEIFQEINKQIVKVDSMNKEDAEYFIFSEQENKINKYQTEMYLNLISPSFEDDNKWRFSTGSGKFFASIKDEIVLNQINSGTKLFGKKRYNKSKGFVLPKPNRRFSDKRRILCS